VSQGKTSHLRASWDLNQESEDHDHWKLGLDTLEARLAADLQTHHAVGLTATIAGAWGRKRSGA
jgi:hypothetical protein